MSQENVEMVRQMFQAFADGGLDAWIYRRTATDVGVPELSHRTRSCSTLSRKPRRRWPASSTAPRRQRHLDHERRGMQRRRVLLAPEQLRRRQVCAAREAVAHRQLTHTLRAEIPPVREGEAVGAGLPPPPDNPPTRPPRKSRRSERVKQL